MSGCRWSEFFLVVFCLLFVGGWGGGLYGNKDDVGLSLEEEKSRGMPNDT